ncbi:MAG: xylulose kinase [Deltaproteobacteria bacterium]|nr:xylulose kinase [Deltaproteobacteria bacterium]
MNHHIGPYVIGIDGGTESIRVGLFDLQGNLLISKNSPYDTFHPRSGWAEQDPEAWWESLRKAMAALLESAQVNPDEINGICADTTCCTVLFLDKNMMPLRNALLWMDVRAAKEARFIADTGHAALKYNGYGNVSAEWMPCKALWVKRNEPDIYQKAATVCEYQDFLNYRLTGEKSASINNASVRWYYDDENGGFPADFYDTIELEDLIEKFPSAVLDMDLPVGRLTAEAASQLGLRDGTVVAEGGADAFVGMLGLNVIQPGRLAFITGSSHLHLGMSPRPFHQKGIFGTYPNSVIRGQHTVEGGQISTGSILKWFGTHFLGLQAVESEKMKKSLYQMMDERAREIPPGSEGLIVLDSFQGNRTPLVDPKLRGAIWGLSLRHRPEHVFRAILEGIAYGTEFIFRRFRDAGYEAKEIFACGGPTRSRLWMQIHADVSNIPINIPRVQDAPLLGSAILATVAAGLYPSVKEAAENMVHVSDRIEPDQKNHEAYQFFVNQYVKTYDQLAGLMHETTDFIA